MTDDPDMERLRAAARSPGASRHSPIYRWMADHRAAFAAMVQATPRPNWPALAAALAAMGLRTATGAAPTGKVARQTWWKVCRRQHPRQAQAPVAEPPLPVPTAPVFGLRFAGGLRKTANTEGKKDG